MSEEKTLQVADSNETAWKIAQSAPRRDLEEIWKELKSEIDFAPDYAENCWYSIPYKDSKTGKTVPVEGVGIHGATALARAWGHNACGGGIREDSSDRVICRGVFYDHMTNTQFYKEVTVNRYQISRDGKTYRLVGKHWDNAVQSAISKAMRNATLHGIPEYLKEKFFDLVKASTTKSGIKGGTAAMTPKQRVDKAREEFKNKFKITAEQFDAYLVTTETEDVVAHLKGLYSGLQTGETTIQETFGGPPEGEKAVQPPQEKKGEK